MRSRMWVTLFFLVALVGMAFWGCSKKDDDTGAGNGDSHSITFVQFADGDTVSDSLTIRVECSSTPDYVLFEFDTFSVADSSAPFEITFDISRYSLGEYDISVYAYWGTTVIEADTTIFIQNYICDPDMPVVLNGDTIEEWRVTRDEYGCVTEIDLLDMGLINPSYLQGIENFGATLEAVAVSQNQLPAIDLTPLSFCPNLIAFDCYSNHITSLDLTPLASCPKLERLGFDENLLSAIDLSPLSACTHLKQLNTGANNITNIDLSPLSHCTELTTLWMIGTGNLVSIDLSPLSDLTALATLDISCNELTTVDLTPLWDLPLLTSLDISNNDLDSSACTGVCSFIDAHPSCSVITACSCGR